LFQFLLDPFHHVGRPDLSLIEWTSASNHCR
jgi:hypothetical protein